MPLPTPKLDDRTFQQLVDEAKQRIPRFTPEWTNFNDSDPGMTLVKLHAWLTETILYRLGMLPDLNYIKFLELLNVQARPAVAARAELSFALKKLSEPTDPLVVLVPKNSQVAVDDPDLEEELIFETDRTLTAINAALAPVIVPGSGGNRELITEYDAAGATTIFRHAFYPFGPTLAQNQVCLIGLLLRPFRKQGADYRLDRFPAGELDLTVFVPEVFEEDAQQQTISGPFSDVCLFPWQVSAEAQNIVWEAYVGSQPSLDFTSISGAAWRRLTAHDDTAALTRSGHLFLEMPGGLPAVSFAALSRSFWASISLVKPPTTAGELADDISNGTLAPEGIEDEVWARLGVMEPTLSTLTTLLGDPVTNRAAIANLLRPLVLNFANVEETVWTEAGESYDLAPVPIPVTWVRARYAVQPEAGAQPPQVSRILLNTVPATAAVTRLEETLGASDGRPGQRFQLRRTPVLVDFSQTPPAPDLTLTVTVGSESEIWRRVDDFFAIGPGDAVYLLDAEQGVITFGDGLHGQIPVAGARIVATRYRYGGGSVGNAGPGTIASLKSAVLNVASVTNVRAAAGGDDAETLDDAKLRAPHDLRTRERAVTSEDFAELARQTPGVPIQRAYALALTRLDTGQSPPALVGDSAGAVTVVVLPENKQETPQPSEEQLQMVCRHLSQRRLITTELYVTGPSYLTLERLAATIEVDRQADLKSVQDALRTALLDYFHPLRGGDGGEGWPFGGDIYLGQVYRQLLQVAHVRRVLDLSVQTTGSTDECKDVVAVPEGSLIYLPATAIDLQVRYDAFS